MDLAKRRKLRSGFKATSPIKTKQYLAFRRRFLIKFFGLFGLSVLFCLGTAAFYINENYSLLMDVAYTTSPGMYKQLNFEKSWLNSFLVVSGLLILLFGYFYVGAQIPKIFIPVEIVRNRLRKLAEGHFNQKPVNIRDTDEFHELVETYNYFQLLLQEKAKQELSGFSNLESQIPELKSSTQWQEILQERVDQFENEDQSKSQRITA